MSEKKTGVELIAQERQEQIEKHKWEDEMRYTEFLDTDLRMAAAYCLTLDDEYYPYEWDNWFKNKVKEKMQRMDKFDFRIEMDKIAGALLAGDIDLVIHLEKRLRTK